MANGQTAQCNTGLNIGAGVTLLYTPKPNQTPIATFQLIRDDALCGMLRGIKATYGVYYNGEYIGVIERPNGNKMWNAYPKGQRTTENRITSKTAAGAAWALVEDKIIKACEPQAVEKAEEVGEVQ